MAEYPLTSLQPRSLFSRRLRLASGVVLFTYVATHLANHAVGLVSLAAADAVRVGFVAVWRTLPLTIVFYGALCVHILLALAALYDRRTLRIPPLELARIALGVCIPFLLATHFVGTRVAYELYGREDDYASIVWRIWSHDRGYGQLTLMCIAWLHGCLGIHFVLRHRIRYRERFYLFFAFAVMLPVLAALGYVEMAREIDARPPGGGLAPAYLDLVVNTRLQTASRWLITFFAAAGGAVLLARVVRSWREQLTARTITLAYPGRKIRVPRGWSVLEASRAHRIPHLSLCGGRGRCSTCRVRISGELAHAPPPLEAEQATLRRIGADPEIRLACQLRPTGDLGVTPLLRPAPSGRSTGYAGVEHDVAILFIDLRRWTTLSEQHLPHDLAYVLDHFFELVGDAVRGAGGVPNQFIGDSVMAIFGIGTDIATASRQALAAAQAIEAGMETAKERMRRHFGQSLEFGIGIHAGLAAVGEVGWHQTRTFTAIGDAVNTAARVQELCKSYGVRLVVSQRVLQAAGVDASKLAQHTVSVRGRTEDLVIYAIGSPSDIELEKSGA
jgi:adenylate cyclase